MITGNTKIAAIIADPIKQVKTPQMVNPIFEELGSDTLMVPVHVSADDLSGVWSSLKAIKNFEGMVVTVPHKTTVAGLCDEISEAAQIVGAVNVVTKTANGTFKGDILDGEGFLAGLLSQGIDPKDMSVLLVGAGGAGSAIAYAFAKYGIKHLTIANRTISKPQDLINRLQASFPDLKAEAVSRPEGQFDLLVNATSLGMDENDPLPVEESVIANCDTVAEIIMKPQMTRLLQTAQDQGRKIHFGEHMLKCQCKQMADFILSN
ncbi:shikimate dehydrogenase family protein [Terasakiella pusilla]|uniref:shikimate dehydrogenase family protein n=1 Tax=Terasakiella pusilla TaxID=64973 RepID=UPI0004903591|nr:shikimate dehydrogenase [Terasakiella pusilla]